MFDRIFLRSEHLTFVFGFAIFSVGVAKLVVFFGVTVLVGDFVAMMFVAVASTFADLFEIAGVSSSEDVESYLTRRFLVEFLNSRKLRDRFTRFIYSENHR